MTKFKFFACPSGSDTAKDLQILVDKWIEENPSISITSSNISENEYRFILIITYTENNG